MYRVLQCAAVLQEAATVITFAVLVKLMLYTLLHIAIGLPPQLSFRSGLASQLLAGSFCAVCWAAGKLYLSNFHMLVHACKWALQCGLVTIQKFCSQPAFTVCIHCRNPLSVFTVCFTGCRMRSPSNALNSRCHRCCCSKLSQNYALHALRKNAVFC